MKQKYILLLLFLILFNCGSSFQSFYNNHKNDIGATSFQVPNFMKAMLGLMNPEAKKVVGSLADLKYIKLTNISESKRNSIVEEMNAVTNYGYKDMFRKNEITQTRIISVKESGIVLTDVILFNSKDNETSAFYLQGRFDPEKIKKLSTEADFDNFTNSLLQSYQTNLNPSFNPNN
jgi:hypothetical protein